jgi:ketosteroid isomerase-like protein
MNKTVRVIDTDPELLRRSAEASQHAAEEMWIHIRAEMIAADGDYEKLMTTLVSEGPYGYTIQPTFNGDGTVRAPILTTWDEIFEAYHEVRGRSDLVGSESLIELRGAWYVFQESASTGRMRADNPNREISPATHMLGIFPVPAGKGITGELVWPRVPVAILGRGDTRIDEEQDPLVVRRQLSELVDRFFRALRASDADALVETMDDDVQTGVRDYVADTGALVELAGKKAARDHYAALFEKFEVVSAEPVLLVVQEWYVFAETRLVLQPRDGGERVACNIAEYWVIGKSGLFFVRVGHGTDLAPTTEGPSPAGLGRAFSDTVV